jgi:hypothetical protein
MIMSENTGSVSREDRRQHSSATKKINGSGEIDGRLIRAGVSRDRIEIGDVLRLNFRVRAKLLSGDREPHVPRN